MAAFKPPGLANKSAKEISQIILDYIERDENRFIYTEIPPEVLEPKLSYDPEESKKRAREAERERVFLETRRILKPIFPLANMLYHFMYKGVSVYVYFENDLLGHLLPRCIHHGLPHNWSIVLCSEGIAIGRIPNLELDKALRHQNRVKLLFWHEADSITSQFDGTPFLYNVPTIPVITQDSALEDLVVYSYLNKNSFSPLPGQEEERLLSSICYRMEELKSLLCNQDEPSQETEEPSQEMEESLLPDTSGQTCAQSAEAEEPPDFKEESPPEDELEGSASTEMSVTYDSDSEVPIEKQLEVTAGNGDAWEKGRQKEAEFWGIPIDKIPSFEEFLKKANLPPELDSNVTMDAKDFAGVVRRILHETIEKLSNSIDQYYVDPSKPLTGSERSKFRSLLLYVMGGLNCQSAETSTVSYKGEEQNPSTVLALRKKIKPEAFQFLFEEFTKGLRASNALAPLFRTLFGYIIAAVDGSDINMIRNGEDEKTTKKNGKDKKSYNQIHLNCIYDCLNAIYLTALFADQGKTCSGERAALYEMVKGLSKEIIDKMILTADRGYESHEAFARLVLSGVRFVLRVKSTESNGVLKLFKGLEEYGDNFQVWIRYRICRKELHEYDGDPYTIKRDFDFLPEDKPLELKLRVLQFRLSSGELETLVTNMPSWELSPYHLYCIYSIRWRIELSYRMLKYQTSVCQLHSTTHEYVRQELWGKLVMFNFSSFIMSHTTIPETKRKHPRKYAYAVKHSRGTVLCRRLMAGDISLEYFSTKLVQRLQPIRPGRSYPRNVRPQSAQSPQTMGVGM